MRTYTDTIQELACLERLRLQTEDAKFAASCADRLRGAVDTLAFLYEADKNIIREDIRTAALLDSLD